MYLSKMTAYFFTAHYSKWPPPPSQKTENNISLAINNLERRMKCLFPLSLALLIHLDPYFSVLRPSWPLNSRWPLSAILKTYDLISPQLDELERQMRCLFPLFMALETLWKGYFVVLNSPWALNPR